MNALILTSLVFVLSALTDPTLSGGVFWDIANAAGFLSLAFLLVLMLDAGAGKRQQIHKLISYLALAGLSLHAGMLLTDSTVWHYLNFNAPTYMWAGLLATIAVAASILLALPRIRRFWHRDYAGFARVHQVVSIVAVIGAVWHVLGSGFYVSQLEGVFYLLLIAGLWMARRGNYLKPQTYAASAAWICLAVPALFVVTKAIL